MHRKGSLSIFPAVQERRQRALEYLMEEPIPVEVTWVYAASGCNMADLIVLQEMDLLVLSETEVWRDPLKNVTALETGCTGIDRRTAVSLERDPFRAWNGIGRVRDPTHSDPGCDRVW